MYMRSNVGMTKLADRRCSRRDAGPVMNEPASAGLRSMGIMIVTALLLAIVAVACDEPKPESTEGGRRVSVLKRQEGAPVLLG